MKITTYGAAGGEVTGSCYHVQSGSSHLLVDCGLFQGGKKSESLNRAPGGRADRLAAVLLTHGHLDHTGRLPLLHQNGFTGPIYATPATIEMASLILRDSARIQISDNERKNRRRQRAGEPPLEPLYTPDDAEAVIRLLRPAPYDRAFEVAPGIHAEFIEAGHMLGSASIKLTAQENGRDKSVVFSGDLGQRAAPILKDAKHFHQADAVFLESTYGDREHRSFAETVKEFVRILQLAERERGKIIVPTFAVGRAQLLTMLLAWAFRTKKVKPFPIYLDSPMAASAWKIYTRHTDLFDDEMKKFMREGDPRQDLRLMKTCATAEESMRLNDVAGPCLIMAGAGMCNAGRIVHHLRNNLYKSETHVVIVGFQSRDSLGRRLVEGEKVVRIYGEKVAVRATIHTLGGFSAHAGQTDLLHWFNAVASSRPKVVLTHGEDSQRAALAKVIHQRHGLKPLLPTLRDTIEI